MGYTYYGIPEPTPGIWLYTSFIGITMFKLIMGTLLRLTQLIYPLILLR